MKTKLEAPNGTFEELERLDNEMRGAKEMNATSQTRPAQPNDMTQGTSVRYDGYDYKIISVKVGDIGGPHVRLVPDSSAAPIVGLVSYRLLLVS